MKHVVDLADEPAEVTSIPRGPGQRIQIPARSLLLVGLCITVATVVAYLLSARQAAVYAAKVDVLVSTRGYTTEVEVARLLETQKWVLGSERVVRPASEKLGLDYRRLAPAVRVGIIGETEVLRVIVQDSDSDRAVRAATEVAESYTRHAWIPPTVSVSDERLRDLNARLADVRAQLAQLGSDSSSSLERDRLETAEATMAKQIDAEQQRLSVVDAERAIPPDARILGPATPLAGRVQPRPERAAVIGSIVGLLVGAAAVVVQRAVDRGVVLLWN